MSLVLIVIGWVFIIFGLVTVFMALFGMPPMTRFDLLLLRTLLLGSSGPLLGLGIGLWFLGTVVERLTEIRNLLQQHAVGGDVDPTGPIRRAFGIERKFRREPTL